MALAVRNGILGGLLCGITAVASADDPYSQTGTIVVTARVGYVLGNAVSGGTMNPPSPDTSGLATTLNTPSEYGKTVQVGTAQPFSLYTNAATDITVTVTNTSGGVIDATPVNPTLKGSITGNPTQIPYHVWYVPCNSSTPIDLAKQCGNAGTGCSINSASNANYASCISNPGKIYYTYDIPSSVNPDIYTGQTALTYQVGA